MYYNPPFNSADKLMDLLPNDMVIEIANNLEFIDVIKMELWGKRYKKIVRETSWTHAVAIKSSRELNGFSKYKLSKRVYPGIEDPELMIILSKCDRVELDSIDASTTKFLSGVKNVKVNCGYRGDLYDLRYLESAEKININDTTFGDPFSGKFRDQLYIESKCIENATIRKSAGKIITNASDFFDLVTRVQIRINEKQDLEAIKYFAKVRSITIDLRDSNSISNLTSLAHIPRISISTFINETIEDSDFDSLTNVKELYLEDFKCITDSAFKCLGSLEELYLEGCDSITGSMLKYTTNLNVLIFYYCDSITNDVFESIGNVSVLDIYNCKKIDSGVLKYLGRIKELTLTNFTICKGDLAFLAAVEKLSLDGCFNSSNKFNVLPNLNSLSLSECVDIFNSAFDDLPQVTQIELFRCPNITNKAFAHMPNLHSVNILHCNSITTNVFKYFRNVRILSCNLEPIGSRDFTLLSNVREIELVKMNLTLAHLEHLTNIEKLSLYECSIDDYNGTDYLPNLKHVVLNNPHKLTSSKLRHFASVKRIEMTEQYELAGEWFRDFANLREFKCTSGCY